MAMRIPLTAVAAVVLLTSLPGCSSHPNRISSAPDSATFQYAGTDMKEAAAEANEHCSTFGRDAKLRNVSQTGSESVATFDCE
jgi:hypothetical protein